MEFTERAVTQYVKWFEQAGGKQGTPGAPRTASQYVAYLLAYADQYGWNLNVDDAEAFVLDQSTQNKRRFAYRALMAFAKWRADRLDTANPLERLPKLLGGAPRDPDPDEENTPIATVEDIEALLMTCGKSKLDLRDRAIILVLASSGMRASECADLKRADISLAERTIYLRGTKNGDNRVTVLSDEAVLALERYLIKRPDVPNGWLWHAAQRCKAQEHLEVSGLSHMITRRAKAAGLAGKVTTHSMRRGFAVRWLDAGGSETYLRVVCGWRRPEMVERYTRNLKAQKAVAQALRLLDSGAA